MDINSLCINCFQPTGGEEVCMNCGFVQSDKPRQLSHLYPHTVLRGRYVIGKVINNGGMGVVYKAYDLKLETVVAIKELFPTQNSVVSRVPGTLNVLPVNEEREKQFINLKKKFIADAQTIARFTNCDSIVHIYDIFEENNTAYIVMEYLEGKTLSNYLKENDDKVDFITALNIMVPVMEALKAVHAKNIIYRDVTPDNIFVCDDNRVKLIDFSSACFMNTDKEVDNGEIVKKPGFTPPELYRTKGKVGDYTDIYSVGAVLYSMLTGLVPEESIDRQERDKLESPSKLGVQIPSYADKSIMKAMALREGARFKRMDDFIRAIQGKKKANYPEIELKKRKIRRTILVAVIFIVLISSVIFTYMMKKSTILIPDHETTIELWYKSYGDKAVDNRWNSKEYISIQKGFDEYAKKQDSPKITLITKGISSNEYNKKLKEALESGKGPDIYQTDGDEFNSYSMSLNNVYNLLEDKNYGNAFKLMKSNYKAKNKIAFYYDMPVVFSRNNKKIPSTLNALSKDTSKSSKCGLVCNPDSFLYTMNSYKNDTDSLKTLSGSYGEYATAFDDNGFDNVQQNFTANKKAGFVSHYIGMASDLPKLTRLRNEAVKQDNEFGIAFLPGDNAKKYCKFPETFSICSKSSSDEQKASQLLFCYLMNYKNEDGQSRVTSASVEITTKYEENTNNGTVVKTDTYPKTVSCFIPFIEDKTPEFSYKGLKELYCSKTKIECTSYDKLDKENEKNDLVIESIKSGNYSAKELKKILNKE